MPSSGPLSFCVIVALSVLGLVEKHPSVSTHAATYFQSHFSDSDFLVGNSPTTSWISSTYTLYLLPATNPVARGRPRPPSPAHRLLLLCSFASEWRGGLKEISHL